MRAKRPIYADTYERRHRRLLIGLIIVAVIIAGIGGWWWLHRNPRPSARHFPVMGVRVDQADGTLDAEALQAGGAEFVYLKATQGASYVDDQFATNYSRAATMTVGVYHYFSFDSTPAAQAANFIDHVGADTGSLPIGIYLTYYGPYASDPPKAATFRAHLSALVQALHQHYQRPVMLMGSPAVLAAVKNVATGSPRWVISEKQPASGQFWEYATAKLPHGTTDKTYASAVLRGNRKTMTQLQQ